MAKKEEQTKPSEQPIDFSQFGSSGFENITQNDLGIPFLTILQKGSPEVDPENAKFVKGLSMGMIINNISKEVYGGKGEPFIFTPYGYQRMYVEWKPRAAGGGVVKAHLDDSILRQTKKNDKGQDVLPNGNTVVNTAYFFGQVLGSSKETFAEGVNVAIGFSSTQLKKARVWLNMMQAIKLDVNGKIVTPPMYAYKWLLSSVPESNEKGSWYGWKIENGGPHTVLNTVKELAHWCDKTKETRVLSIEASANNELNDDDKV